MPVFITGTGLVTPLDSAAESTFQAIQAGKRLSSGRGIVPETTLTNAFGLPHSSPENIHKCLSNKCLDKSIRLAYLAALQAIHRAGWTADQLTDPGTALFVGTSKGPILSVIAASDYLRRAEPLPAVLAEQIALGPAAIGTLLALQLGLRGPMHTTVAACSSGLHALHFARQAVAQGKYQKALVVASDASVHPLFEASFARLGVLAKPRGPAETYCEPFGAQASGFFLTEAAAAVTLESAAPGPLLLRQTLIAADATHLLAVDSQTESLRRSLSKLLSASEIAFIHAHATGTEADHHEFSALRSAFPNAQLDSWPPFTPLEPNRTPVFSHKRYLGHSLGAAGLVAVVLSAACHAHRLTLAGAPLNTNRSDSLTVAQGFGGHIGLTVLSSQ